MSEMTPENYPHVAILRFKTADDACEVLTSLDAETVKLDYREDEKGKNIYYVDTCLPDPE